MKNNIYRGISLLVSFLFVTVANGQSTINDFIGLSMDTVTSSIVLIKTEKNDISQNKDFDIKKVNKAMIGPLYSHIPKSYSIEKSLDVGEIAYQASVGPNGSTSIQVPIDIYHTPEEFDPSIALVYNSLSGNSAFGFGWNASCISVISRTNKSYYYDGVTEGLNLFSAEGPFSLDGKRLIKIDKSSKEIIFQSEQGHIKVYGELSGSSINGFKVLYPNGKIGIYGISDRFNYYLTEISDGLGHKISYSYTFVNNHYRIDEINYGAKSRARVKFKYEQLGRLDPKIVFYNSGVKIKYDYSLSSITSYVNGQELKKYTIFYRRRFRNLVEKITCSASGNELNPLIFYYGKDGSHYSGDAIEPEYERKSVQLTEYFNADDIDSKIRVAKGKFDYGTNNDGIIMFPNRIHYKEEYISGNFTRSSVRKFINDYGNHDDNIIIARDINDSFALTSKIKTGWGFIDAFCMDVDQNPGEEIVKVNNYEFHGDDRVDFHVYACGRYGQFTKKYKRTFNFKTILKHNHDRSINPKFYYTGDFNGDGKMELLFVTANNPLKKGLDTKCCMIDLEKDKIIYEGSPFAYTVDFPRQGSYRIDGTMAADYSDKLFTLDYNGDGKTDLCLINEKGINIYSFSEKNNSISCSRKSLDTQLTRAMMTHEKSFYLGEFNGDGKPDIFLSPKEGDANWSVYSSKGDGKFEKKMTPMGTRPKKAKYVLQDINLDGLTDIIEIGENEDPTDGKNRLTTYFISDERNSGFIISEIPQWIKLIPTNLQSRNYYYNLISLNQKGVITKFSMPSHNLSETGLLTGLIDSKGAINLFQYKKMNEDIYTYMKDSGATFPYQDFCAGLNVCSNSTTYYNGVRVNDFSYRYGGAIVHKQGLGFRGFKRFTQYDILRSKEATQTYDPFNYSILLSEESESQKNEYEYDINVSPNKIRQILVKQKRMTNKVSNTITTTKYSYDNYGNCLEESSKFGAGLATVTTRTFNNVVGEKYALGLPLTEKVTHYRNGESHIAKSIFTYNSDNLIKSKTTYLNDTYQIDKKVYSYDDKYRLSKVETQLYSSPNKFSVSYMYNDNNQIVSKTDEFGLKESYIYDSKEFLVGVKDNSDNLCSYNYDVWGRKIKSTFPDKTTQTVNFSWALSPENALILKTESSTNTPTKKTFLDAFGRVVKSSSVCFDGTLLHQSKKYDSWGRLKRESYPYKTEAQQWKTYTYDRYDRIINVSYDNSNKQENFSYNGLDVTSTTEGITRTKIYNELGDLLCIKDVSGDVVYNYRTDGSLSSIIAPGDITTSFSYDEYGRKTKIVDPSAGTITYAYDDAGNVVSEINGKGQSLTMSYDVLNRLVTKKYENGIEAMYQYNSDNTLNSIYASNGTNKTYNYDNLKRLITEKETNGRYFLLKTYNYSNGSISKIDYKGSVGIGAQENYYYANGHLVEIKLDNRTSIWKKISEDAKGHLTEYKTGILNHYKGYNSQGILTSIQCKPGARLGVIQKLEYNFDSKTGNLLWRKDIRSNIRENFEYDDLNRLTNYGGKMVDYDIKGNIVSLSSVGKFDYDQNKPYAISSIRSLQNQLSFGTQTISYNSMQRASSIEEKDYKAIFDYNIDGKRSKMELKKKDQSILTRYYIGGKYTIDVTPEGIKEKLYLGGDTYTSEALLERENNQNNLYFLCKDYLGSITQVVHEGGRVVEELSYDAWGNLRDPKTLEVYKRGEEPELFLGRGYTGHEHLSQFGLINMNARLYDPVLGRFLSPDPFVQSPDLSQNFNRYSYCLNNPLKYTDPTGELFGIDDFLFAVVVGAVANVAFQGISGNIGNGADFFKAVGIGALSGAAGFGAGALAAGGLSAATSLGGNILNGAIIGGAGGLAGGFVGGTGNAWAAGASFSQGLKQGLIGGGIGALSGALIGGAAGAYRYYRQMVNFCKGCKTMGIESGDPVPKTDDFLSKAQKTWYDDFKMDKVRKFTVEHVPENIQNNLTKNSASACTKPIFSGKKFTGYSKVYFNGNIAFQNAKYLYFTMGHELVHASQFFVLKGESSSLYNSSFKLGENVISFKSDLMEFHAYSFQNSIGGSSLNSFSNSAVRAMYNRWPDLFKKLSYSNFGWTHTCSFVYPFK